MVFGFLVFGFLVSWFLLVSKRLAGMVSKLLGFKVPKLLGCKVSNFQRLKKSLHVFKKDGLRITTNPCHVFWKIVIPYARFPRIYQTGHRDLSETIVSNILKMLDVHNFEIYKHDIFKNAMGFVLNLWRCPRVSKDKSASPLGPPGCEALP